MSKFTRFLSIALTLSLLWGCGRISDLTYEKAANFEGITFPPESSVPSQSSGGQTPSSGSSVSAGNGSAASSADASSVPSASFDPIDGGYYYENLTAAQQESYVLLLEGFRNHAEEITGLSEDSTEVFPAVSAIYFDHPELAWLQNGGGQLFHGTGVGTYIPEYKFDADEGSFMVAEAQAAAEAFLSSADPNASDYEKVRAVFEYLVDTVDYKGDDENCRDIYGALVEKEAVCAGYAAAAQYLLTELDVPCITAAGTVLDGGSHAWNIVWLDGEPYHMDATWGDPSFGDDTSIPDGFRNYRYLLMTTDEVLEERIIDEDICAMPLCTSDYDYFAREGLFLNAYPGSIGEIFVDAYTAGESWVSVSFGENVALDDVLYMLFECNEFYSFFDAAGISIGSVSYNTDEPSNSLTVFFQN